MATHTQGEDDLDICYMRLLEHVIWQAQIDSGRVKGRNPVVLEPGDKDDAIAFLMWCWRCLTDDG